ncbi:hypothetical protein CCR95_00790 [Thiocystis minor]|uniref:hypothetical protein n=1 Tax=Thiocystis minor TaxID=61597 RepID=UPI001914D31D|nr:hypothetical protein [Thiocystis minor]MBK5962676.1 hypothetical protein [Thiocystis minor]
MHLITPALSRFFPLSKFRYMVPAAVLMTAAIDVAEAAVTFNDPVVLIADMTISDGDHIDFKSTIDGPHNLTLNTPGVTTFQGTVGGTLPLAALTTDAAGTTTLGGNVTAMAIHFNDLVTLTSEVTLGGVISLASLAGGGRNLTLAAGSGPGGSMVQGVVNNLGSGTGAALTISPGVIGPVHFLGTLGGNSGLLATPGSNVSFEQDVTLGNGDTGTNLPGLVALNGLTFSGYDGISFGTTTVRGKSTINANGFPLALGATTLAGTLTLVGATTLNLGTVSGNVAGGLLALNASGAVSVGSIGPNIDTVTLINSGGATFAALTAVTLALQGTNGNIVFNGDLSLGNLNTAAQNYNLALLGASNFVISATTFNNTG